MNTRLTFGAIAATLLTGPALAAPVTLLDTFDYPDQSAFESVYDITIDNSNPTTNANPTDGSVTLDLSGGQSDVDLLARAGTSNFARMTNTESLFELSADAGADLSVEAVGGEVFDLNARVRVGLVSADDAGDRIYLQFEGRSGRDTRVRIYREVDGSAILIGDSQDQIAEADRYSTFGLEIGQSLATATRNGTAIGGSTTDQSHNLDYSNYSSGAYLFVEINTAGNGDRRVTVDDLAITATPVPEPGSLGLLATGALLLGRRRREVASA